MRVASQAWIVFFSSIVKSIGVVSDTVGKGHLRFLGRSIFRGDPSASADRLPVVVRIPGPLGSLKCDPPKGNGRRPQKNGRSIFRRADSSALYMQVDPTYLDEAFAEFDLKKGSTTFPDLRPILSILE